MTCKRQSRTLESQSPLSSSKIVSLQALKFRYPGQSSWLMQIPSLDIRPGEKVFLRGPSGCGKSTLLEILSGLLSPSEGKISVLGSDLTALSSRQRDRFRADHVGYIFQRFNLLPYLTARENILLPLRLRSRTINDFEQDLSQLANSLGISEIMNQRTSQLSVGQQQRVAAARALIGSPELLLADEPTSALDEEHRERFIKLLFDLCSLKKITLLFVSHDRSLENLFDRSLHWAEINGPVAQTVPHPSDGGAR